MQCWRRHRVTPPELASHFVCPFCLTLFFRHTGASNTSGSEKLHNCSGARVRSLQDRTNHRVLGGLRTTKLVHTLSDMEICDAGLGKCTTPQAWGCLSRCGMRNESCFTPSTWLRTCQRSAALAQHPVQFCKFLKSKPKTRLGQSFVAS